MKELIVDGDLFAEQILDYRPDAVAITTNGYVKTNGEAVMGRGIAAYFKDNMNTRLPRILGHYIKHHGNVVNLLYYHKMNPDIGFYVVSFPVKPVNGMANFDRSNITAHNRMNFVSGGIVPGWAMKADLSLILKSAVEISDLACLYGWKSVFLSRPGCNNGELDWEEVSQHLSICLDDRFTVFHSKSRI